MTRVYCPPATAPENVYVLIVIVHGPAVDVKLTLYLVTDEKLLLKLTVNVAFADAVKLVGNPLGLAAAF